jgi:hypothetical protein
MASTIQRNAAEFLDGRWIVTALSLGDLAIDVRYVH